MAKNTKLTRKKHQAEIVTGDFELHFEDVVNRNRYSVIAFITGGLLLLTLVVPGAVYYSRADTNNSLIEAENGKIINQESVNTITPEGASEGYVEFVVP